MTTKHRTRSRIADEVPGVEYEHFRSPDHIKDGFGFKTEAREFTKDELIAINEYLRRGLFIGDRDLKNETKKRVRNDIRDLLDFAEYRNLGKHDWRDGKPLRRRELLNVRSAVSDASENLRWEGDGE